jgi:hypothetical protein
MRVSSTKLFLSVTGSCCEGSYLLDPRFDAFRGLIF